MWGWKPARPADLVFDQRHHKRCVSSLISEPKGSPDSSPCLCIFSIQMAGFSMTNSGQPITGSVPGRQSGLWQCGHNSPQHTGFLPWGVYWHLFSFPHSFRSWPCTHTDVCCCAQLPSEPALLASYLLSVCVCPLYVRMTPHLAFCVLLLNL